MAFDYSESRELAEELITEFGGTGTFVKEGSTGGYDDSGNVIATEDDITISGTVTPLLSFSQSEADGERVLSSDNYVFFHSDTAPEIGYIHTQNGVKYRMVSMLMELTSVDGINVFRKIQLRN